MVVFPQSAQEEVVLVNQIGELSHPGEVLRDVCPYEFETSYTAPPFIWMEVHDELLGVVGVEQQVVVFAPQSQAVHLLPIGRLIIILDEAKHGGINRKPDNGLEPCAGFLLWVKRE